MKTSLSASHSHGASARSSATRSSSGFHTSAFGFIASPFGATVRAHGVDHRPRPFAPAPGRALRYRPPAAAGAGNDPSPGCCFRQDRKGCLTRCGRLCPPAVSLG